MERKLGPNMKRLLAHKVALDAVPNGGGMMAAFTAIATPGRLEEISRAALIWCDEAINAVRSAPDNPYGDDEEDIAEAILIRITN